MLKKPNVTAEEKSKRDCGQIKTHGGGPSDMADIVRTE